MRTMLVAGIPLVIALASPLAGAPSPPFTLFMSPNGSDGADGLTPATALRTLEVVQRKLIAYKPVIDQDVEVRIHHVGTTPYRSEHVEWTHTSPTYTISFMPSDYVVGADIDTIAGRPVFDGGGTQEWFFELHSSNGEPTNLRFYYLRIQNYTSGGIAFVAAERPAARAF